MTSPQQTTASSAGRKPHDDEIDAYGLSHPGKVRESNQDHFLIASLRKQMQVHLTSLPSSDQVSGTERLASLAMVADGVGGGPKGEEASRMAAAITQYVTESMQCYYGARDEESLPTELEEAALRCHMDLTRSSEGDAERTGMATTLTVWLGVRERLLSMTSAKQACESLLEDALDAGGSDNVTILVRRSVRKDPL